MNREAVIDAAWQAYWAAPRQGKRQMQAAIVAALRELARQERLEPWQITTGLILDEIADELEGKNDKA